MMIRVAYPMIEQRAPSQLTVSELVQEARRESTALFRHQPTEHACGFELFRRALVLHDEEAWAGIYDLYRVVIGSWLLRPGSVLSKDEHESLMNEVFMKFCRSVGGAEKFAHFHSVPPLLSYLKRTAHSVLTDHHRLCILRRCEEPLESLDQEQFLDEDTADRVEERLASQEVWQIICSEVTRREERLILQAVCLLDWSPRELQQCYSRLFPTIEDVYREKRNVLERLRHNPQLQALLQQSRNGEEVGLCN